MDRDALPLQALARPGRSNRPADPTPGEIEAACRRIRSSWSESVARERAGLMPGASWGVPLIELPSGVVEPSPE
jgi:hypothetical protein